ncbi:hypothetical protein [Roseobacter sp. S98]|uniref:hypothetical protein n=1 Tax=Roseobacter algicola (ex Choi et al. 2025) (nom. illeg.) TaxID=3092138 RepID=UPI0035C7219A
MAKFDVVEIVLLSMGLEPAEDLRSRFDPDFMKRRNKSPADDFALRRFEMFRRQFSPNRKNGSVYPRDLVMWVRSVDLDAHPAFLRMTDTFELLQNGAQLSSSNAATAKNANETKPAEGRELASLAKLLIAIAIEEYGYQPASLRSPILKEIEAITDRHGLSASHDTVRKYLRMGARYLPKDE